MGVAPLVTISLVKENVPTTSEARVVGINIE